MRRTACARGCPADAIAVLQKQSETEHCTAAPWLAERPHATKQAAGAAREGGATLRGMKRPGDGCVTFRGEGRGVEDTDAAARACALDFGDERAHVALPAEHNCSQNGRKAALIYK